jgi:hypothetical protein
VAGGKGVMRTYDDSFLYIVSLVLKCLNLFCFQAAEVQSTKEKLLSFWGDKLDKNVESFIRKYCEEVYRELSCFSKRGSHMVAIILSFLNFFDIV